MKKILVILVVAFLSLSFIVGSNSTIYITSMGNVKNSDVVRVQKELSSFYNCNVIILPKIDLMTDTKVKGMNRYQSEKILNNIIQKFYNKRGKVLVLTDVDICFNNGKNKEHWGIFGLGMLYSKPCVVSTNRLKTNRDNRLVKVAIHEIGHTFGLNHCDNDKKCVMNDAKGKGSTVDGVNKYLCPNCKTKLELLRFL
jgi:archaemetzincin